MTESPYMKRAREIVKSYREYIDKKISDNCQTFLINAIEQALEEASVVRVPKSVSSEHIEILYTKGGQQIGTRSFNLEAYVNHIRALNPDKTFVEVE